MINLRLVLKSFSVEKGESDQVGNSTELSFAPIITAIQNVQRNLERLGYDDLYLTLDELVSKHLQS